MKWHTSYVLIGIASGALLMLLGIHALRTPKNISHECPFCAIIAGTAPRNVICETDDLIVIEKKPPRSTVDCLIIPKKHIENIMALDMNTPSDAELGSKVLAMAQCLSKQITGKGHFQLWSNNGADAGQTVFHMHWHFKAPGQQWKRGSTRMTPSCCSVSHMPDQPECP